MIQPDILASWVKAYTRDLLSWAIHKVSDRVAAEDLVQDTFLIATEKSDQFRNDSNPRTWLFGILNNKIAEYYRSKSKFTKIDLGEDKTLDEFFDESGNWKKEIIINNWDSGEKELFNDPEFIEAFQKCMGNLPLDWNRCITMKYLEEKDAPAVCQELGITDTNYWQIVHRAKLKLRRCLEKNWFNKNRE